MSHMRKLLFLLLLCAPVAGLAVDAATERASVERRIASVHTLIESSSAAREIDAAAVPAALARRSEARQAIALADDAFANGDLRSASALAENAARQLIAAARLARGERAHDAENERDLALRAESARALLAAQRRIGKEKASPEAAQLGARIEALLDEAKAQAEAGHIAQARPLVEQAYLLAKASISSMRGGDTLVRSLTFASAEEEYRYELDRNDTHRMLLTLFLKRQGADPEAQRDTFTRSQALRTQAEAKAARGEHAEAIRLLEDSTRELQRAIRAQGIYIPG
jgi:hypothetical protein